MVTVFVHSDQSSKCQFFKMSFFFLSSWVENFGREGLGLLLDVLERLVETKK